MYLNRTNHVPGCFEAFSMVFRRVYHSFGYWLLYGCVLVLNLVMILWLVAHQGSPKPLEVFILLELAVTIALVLEVVYTLKTQGFKKWIAAPSNWFDFLVAVVCSLSLVAYSIGGEDMQEGVAVGVASVRYVTQTARLCVLLRHAGRKNAQGIAEFEQVRFDVNFDAPVEPIQANANPSPRLGEHSPVGTNGNYWGRGRAFSTSPIFQNPKRPAQLHLDHTIKVQEPAKSPVPLVSPLSLPRNSSAPSVHSLQRESDSTASLQQQQAEPTPILVEEEVEESAPLLN